MRISWIVLLIVTGFAACVESEPWPEAEMDVRNFPKESPGWEDTGAPTPPAPRCGDNVINGRSSGWLEECDGVTLNGRTCATLGYEDGSLRCTDDCFLDFSDCNGAQCGNGHLDDTEACEILVRAGTETTLVCAPGGCPDAACDESCAGVPLGTCGDGVIQAPAEECEGSTFHPAFIEYAPGSRYRTGSLSCTNCVIDYSNARPTVCGNGRLEVRETCEGPQIGVREETDGGRRQCVNCSWEPDATYCGDGRTQREWGEQCDGRDVNELCRYPTPVPQPPRVPCEDCLLRRDLCPEPPSPTPPAPMDAGNADVEDAGTIPAVDATQGQADAEGSAADPPTEEAPSPEEPSGCSAGSTRPGTTRDCGWLLLFVMSATRLRRPRSRRTA